MKISELNERANLINIIADLFGAAAASHLHPEHGGVILDPRSGFEERNPSFSVYRREGMWRWKRFGADNAGGTAYDLLTQQGYSPREAWVYLMRIAGLSIMTNVRTGSQASATVPRSKAHVPAFEPLTAEELEKVDLRLAPLGQHHQAATDLKRRGLWASPNLTVALLRSSYGPSEKLLARPGSLAISIPGPDGQTYAVKVRNLGTAQDLEQQGLKRYVYITPGHSTPAWCSPNYGQNPITLMIEGELNAAAAHLALSSVGYSVDVQGLAGAGGWPFLLPLCEQEIYIYADPDEAGQACITRVANLALDAGAKTVRIIAPNAEDFCDLLGRADPEWLGAWLLKRMQESIIYQPQLPDGNSGGKTVVQPAVPTVLQSDQPLVQKVVDKYQRKMKRILRRGR